MDQVRAFHHDEFVASQLSDFRDLVGERDNALVVDIGGGCGFFARGLADLGPYRTRVLELDDESIASCRTLGIDVYKSDALAPDVQGDEDVITFNLILHHLVAPSDVGTRELQLRVLRAWRDTGALVFVNEYIYQSVVGRVSPRLIYQITASQVLSRLGRVISRFVPALRANTFGVGVRFRTHEDWLEIFDEAGFDVVGVRIGEPEPVSPFRRLLLIKTIRRDSFLLKSKGSAGKAAGWGERRGGQIRPAL